jgi:hypothetical protein
MCVEIGVLSRQREQKECLIRSSEHFRSLQFGFPLEAVPELVPALQAAATKALARSSSLSGCVCLCSGENACIYDCKSERAEQSWVSLAAGKGNGNFQESRRLSEPRPLASWLLASYL